jgi:class 3 adenylate cyclase
VVAWETAVVAAPSRTVTFLFTDIEGSSRLWESAPEAMRAALARHNEIVRSPIEGHGGPVFSPGGDRFGAVFGRAGDALAAARNAVVDAQRRGPSPSGRVEPHATTPASGPCGGLAGEGCQGETAQRA